MTHEIGLWVRSDLRSRGLGTQMMKAALADDDIGAGRGPIYARTRELGDGLKEESVAELVWVQKNIKITVMLYHILPGIHEKSLVPHDF